MKKQLALLAVSFALVMGSSAIAQDAASSTPSATAATPKAAKKAKSGGAAANKAEAELASLTESLSLTEDQQAKIKPILADQSSKIHGGGKKGGASGDDVKAKNKAIRDDANKQIRALLTPDQQKTFDGLKKSGNGGGKKKSAAAAPAA
jgi:Spy/CpxP family protein refolding chaperone